MTQVADTLFEFDNTFVRDLPGLYEVWDAAPFADPRLMVLNEDLAAELGLDVALLRSPRGAALMVANPPPYGAAPVAQAYSGHQFGNYNPRLGDGRALLLGEVVDRRGRRRDLHLKGSGRTPFARGGDGKAALGPMLREYVMGEAMHALGIPTTRALAVLTTGELIARDSMLPGAVLHRVAASHLRVGTVEYAARLDDGELTRRLADYVIERHYPLAAGAENPYLALFSGIVERQASLVAKWMLVGFIHGVMNTDNMTLSGETIDYGPCAFMDAYDPATVFSSIDSGGRYAYGNQPRVAQWNLARLAEALLPWIDADRHAAAEAATDVLRSFVAIYEEHLARGMAAKLGLTEVHGDSRAEVASLGTEFLALLAATGADFTGAFRSLSSVLRGDASPVIESLRAASDFGDWCERWMATALADGRDAQSVSTEMESVNPLYVPRNHLVDEALAEATAGDLTAFERLVAVVSEPFRERAGLERYAQPAPPEFVAGFRTFCGT